MERELVLTEIFRRNRLRRDYGLPPLDIREEFESECSRLKLVEHRAARGRLFAERDRLVKKFLHRHPHRLTKTEIAFMDRHICSVLDRILRMRTTRFS